MSSVIHNRFLEWVPDPVWVMDANYQLVTFNSKASKYFFDFNKLELKPGVFVLDAFPDEMKLEWQTWVKKALQGEVVKHRMVYDFQGQLIRFLIHFRPIEGEKPEEKHVLVYSQDLTKIQQDLGISDLQRDLLEYTLSSIEDGLFEWEIKTDIIYFSHRWCAMLGYTEDQLVPNLQQIFDLLHVDDLLLVRQQFEAIAKGEVEHLEIEYRLRCADGSYKWIFARGKNLRIDQKEAGRFVGTHIDISAKKQDEMVQKRHELLLRALYDASTVLLDPTIVIDQRILASLALIGNSSRVQRIHLFKFLPTGGCMRRYFWNEDKGSGANDWNLENQQLHHFDLPKNWETQLKANQLIRGMISNFPEQERPFLDIHGVKSVLMVPLMVKNDNWGFITFDDLTLETEFLDANVQIMMNFGIALGHAKTRDYFEQHFQNLNNQLSKKNEELEQSVKELDQFAYIVSHDLKAPLRAINNLADWIEEDLEGKVESDVASHLSLLKQRVGRMGHLIDGILKYSRAGREPSVPQQVNCVQLIEELKLLIGMDDRILVRTGQLPTIETDKLKLQQVFANLLTNAVKYGHSEKPMISVSYENMDGVTVFCVQDNGPGLSPEYHEKIFNIFTMLDKPKDDSTGIGLAIVKKIVEERGGKVWVESEPGMGAGFYFEWVK